MTVRRWWLVSDLHLDAASRDPRGTGPDFADFLHQLVAPEAGTSAVVLLGDTFELSGMPGAAADVRLTEIAARHPEVFAALRHCLACGAQLHIVAGNHDVDLVRPAARRRLRNLLEVRGAGPVFVHPWMVHVPGVLLAEHGHQHHLVHRMPTLLTAAADDGSVLPTPPLVAWSRAGGTTVSRAVSTAAALTATRRAERQALETAHRRLLDSESGRMRLSRPAGRDLWRASRFRVLPAVAGAAGRMLRRRWSPEQPAAVRTPAFALRTAEILRRHDAGVRWYVTGHTHRAEAFPLTDGTAYLNTGTWCSDIRGAGPDLDDPTAYPYVLIDLDGPAPRAVLGYWQAARNGPVAPLTASRRSP